MFFCKKSDRNGFLTLRYHLWREAYVPLEPSFPPQRLRFMLEDSQVPWNILERFGRWRIWFIWLWENKMGGGLYDLVCSFPKES